MGDSLNSSNKLGEIEPVGLNDANSSPDADGLEEVLAVAEGAAVEEIRGDRDGFHDGLALAEARLLDEGRGDKERSTVELGLDEAKLVCEGNGTGVREGTAPSTLAVGEAVAVLLGEENGNGVREDKALVALALRLTGLLMVDLMPPLTVGIAVEIGVGDELAKGDPWAFKYALMLGIALVDGSGTIVGVTVAL